MGTPRPVTPEGTRDGWPAPNGSAVLARGKDGSFQLFPMDGGSGRPVPSLPADASVVRFSPDAKAVYFYRRAEIPARLMRLDLASGGATFVREIAPPDRAGILSIYEIVLADDDRWYVYNTWILRSSLYVAEQAGLAAGR